MEPLGLGIIGLHHQHPRWYHPLWANLPMYEVKAIAEPDDAFLESEREFFSGLEAYTDYRKLLEREDVDVVIIWLPHSCMPQAVADAAAAGKHVIVEKPCAADVDGAQRIVDVAHEHPDVRISAPYCWRTHPVSQRIRQAVDDGLLGEIIAMEGRLNAGGAHRYVRDNASWMLREAEGGGPMWNLGVHWIDYFRWITGQEVESVYGAVALPAGEPERDIEDSAQAILTFEGGATAMLDISYSLPASYPGSRDIYMAIRGRIGDVAWAPAWESLTDELLLVSEHESLADDQRCRRLPITSNEIPGYCGHMAWAWLKEFAEAVCQDRQPQVIPDDILAAIEVVDAFKRSLTTGCRERVGM